MNSNVRIACLQLNTQGDLNASIREIDRLARQAASEGAIWLSLPECAFFMRGDDNSPPHHYLMQEHPGLHFCTELAAELHVSILIGSLFVRQEDAFGDDTGKWVNRSVLINAEGNITAHYDKIHLFDACFGDGESYRESDRFMPGRAAQLAMTPFGQLGMTICYDVRFAYLYRNLALNGAIAMSIPAAFARRTGEAHWHVLLRARAIETGSYVIAPAQCGSHPGGRQTFGHSMVVDPWGKIIAEAEQDVGFITALIQPEYVEETRRNMPVLKHGREYIFQDYAI